MKASQKIALEMSEKREQLNALLAMDELSDDQRADMATFPRGCNSSKSRPGPRSWPKMFRPSRPRPSRMAKTASCDP